MAAGGSYFKKEKTVAPSFLVESTTKKIEKQKKNTKRIEMKEERGRVIWEGNRILMRSRKAFKAKKRMNNIQQECNIVKKLRIQRKWKKKSLVERQNLIFFSCDTKIILFGISSLLVTIKFSNRFFVFFFFS